MFDFTMGSFMGAEVCDLIGLYILHDVQQILSPYSYRLYRDDGLAVLDNSLNVIRKETLKRI